MTSLLRCPLCRQPLTRGERSYTCPGGHCFDLAAAGYTYLLPPNQKHSRNPGDDKAMVAARSAFLDRGHYAPLRDLLCRLAVEAAGDSPSPAALDSGCGEGYYTAALHRALSQAEHGPRTVGVDISKFALHRAARRLPEGEFAVASVYRLPLTDGSVDLLTNVFSPLSPGEFARVLAPGGTFLYVVPSARHLWEMKQVLYDAPYENPVKREDYPGFVWQDAVPLRYRLHLEDPQDIAALLAMTPYAWKTPRAGVERLRALGCLDVEAGFDIHIYRRQQRCPASPSALQGG